MNTVYFVNAIAEAVFRAQESSPIPTTFYIGLSATKPTQDGESIFEPTDSNYSRVAITFSQPSGGLVTNSSDIIFPRSQEAWGTMRYFLVFDAQNGGTLLMYNPLPLPYSVGAGVQPKILAGYLKISVLKND